MQQSMSQHTAPAILAETTFRKTVAYRSSSVTLARVCNSNLSLAVMVSGFGSVPSHHEVSGGRGAGRNDIV